MQDAEQAVDRLIASGHLPQGDRLPALEAVNLARQAELQEAADSISEAFSEVSATENFYQFLTRTSLAWAAFGNGNPVELKADRHGLRLTILVEPAEEEADGPTQDRG